MSNFTNPERPKRTHELRTERRTLTFTVSEMRALEEFASRTGKTFVEAVREAALTAAETSKLAD